jgi:plasmid maintenance system antidote protein VapI
MKPMSERNENAAPDKPISRALRETIRKRGLTAYATAKQAGVSVDAVQRFINDQRGLNLETVDKLANSLDLKLCEDENAEQDK